MLGRVAPEGRDASRQLEQKTNRGNFFMLGMRSSFKFQAFLARDKNKENLLLLCLETIRPGLKPVGFVEQDTHQSHRWRLDGS